jgi:hypothetical protein
MQRATTVREHVEHELKRTTKPYAEIAAETRKLFQSATSPSSVRHYASKLRRSGARLKERPIGREVEYI